MLRPAPSFLRSLAIAAVLFGGIAGSFVLYRLALRHEATRFEDDLGRQIDNRHALIGEALHGCDEALFALRLLFDGSERVSPAEFSNAAAEVLRRHRGVYAIQWLPRVPASGRDDWERAHALPGADRLPVMEHARDGSLHPAGARAAYFPVLYSEPAHADWNPVGCDLGVGRLGTVLAGALERREPAMSGRITLLTQDGNRHGVLLAAPVFDPHDRRVLRGYLVGILQLDTLIAEAWSRARESMADVMIVDDSATEPDARRLFFRPAVATTAPVPDEAAYRRTARRELPISIGGRHWLALYQANPGFAQPTGRLPRILLGSSLLTTFLLVAYLTLSARHTRLVEREVSLRTAELSENRRQLDTLIQALPGMAYRARLSGDHTEMIYVSDGVELLTGHPPQDFLDGTVNFADLIHPADRDAAALEIGTALHRERRPFELTNRLCLPDGQVKWVLSRGRGVYDDRGTLLFFEGLAIDITAQREAEAGRIAIERKLLDSQKLESLGLLAGGIAHDFNNLLAGMLGHVDLARLQLADRAPVTDHLDKIATAASRAAELCQQMLAYSGRGRFLVEPIDLNRLVDETLPLLHGALSTRARLELSLAPAAPHILADATQIRQIVMNLIINAGDALGEREGQVIVSSGVRRFEAGFLRAARGGEQLVPGEFAFLEVQDTGCGMTPETMARIFDPFFTTKFTGRGLGLAAVLGIVRGHSGALHVESAPGVGSTFTLLLPALTGATAPASPADAAEPAPWQGSGRVLVIDDEAAVRDVAVQLLLSFGFAVESAADGQDGLARFRQAADDYQLVLLDLTMPGMNGEEVLAGLRAISPRVRVILMSGYSENDRVTRLAGEGPLGFLQKPFKRASLERKLRAVFG